MSATAARFRQSDVTRALKGARAAGVMVKIEIDPNGTMHLLPIAGGISVPAAGSIDGAVEAFTW